MVNAGSERVDWVDGAKGICIILVVMMHATLGVEDAAGRTGFMHAVVEFARPFRMPDFFLISGLFLARVIDRDWRTYLDRKVVHFAYFYVLWVTIQFGVKAPGMIAANGAAETLRAYLLAYIEPFGTLWFIYLLPVFFVVTKLTRAVPPLVVWIVAAGLEVAPIHTGWTVIDEFASRFVYFYSGYVLAPHVFQLAADVQANRLRSWGLLAAWAVLNAWLVHAGYATLPVLSLVLGVAGAMAIVSVAALLAKSAVFAPVRYCGEHSIVIYLAFFLPMAVVRIALLQSPVPLDVGLVSLIDTASGVVGALLIWWAVRGTRLYLLFERPPRFWIAERRHVALQPAE
jgi:uncharacterized membrane protein YcfT